MLLTEASATCCTRVAGRCGLRTFYLADLDLYALAAHAELLRTDAHRDQAPEGGGADTHLHITE